MPPRSPKPIAVEISLCWETWLIVAQACGRAAVDPAQSFHDQLTASAAAESILKRLRAAHTDEELDNRPPWDF